MNLIFLPLTSVGRKINPSETWAQPTHKKPQTLRGTPPIEELVLIFITYCFHYHLILSPILELDFLIVFAGSSNKYFAFLLEI